MNIKVATRISRANLSFSQGKQVRFVGRVLEVQGNQIILEATDGKQITVTKNSDDLAGQNLSGRIIEIIGCVESPNHIREDRTFLWGDISFKEYEDMLRVCSAKEVFN